MKKWANLKAIFLLATIVGLTSMAQCREFPERAFLHLEQKKSSIRELITDCTERSISLSCHRAGVYYIDTRHNIHEGMLYLRNACELGRGYSCTVLGNMYSERKIVDYNFKYAKTYYNQGCLRGSEEGCKKRDLLVDTTKKSFWQKLFGA